MKNLKINLFMVLFLVSASIAFAQETVKDSTENAQLEEVVVIGKGVMDLAKDRKTPIAVSSIKAAEIQAKVGSSDITQTMVNTPSVYVAGQYKLGLSK